MTLMLLLIAAALVGASGTAPAATFSGHRAKRGPSAVESVEKTRCLQGQGAAEHDGADDVGTLGVQHTDGPPPTPTGTSTPNHVPRTVEGTTSNKIAVDKMTSNKTFYKTMMRWRGESAGGPPPTGGMCWVVGRSADAPAKNAARPTPTPRTQPPRCTPVCVR